MSRMVEKADVEGRGHLSGLLHFLYKIELIDKAAASDVIRRMKPCKKSPFYLINTLEHVCQLNLTK